MSKGMVNRKVVYMCGLSSLPFLKKGIRKGYSTNEIKWVGDMIIVYVRLKIV